MHIELGRKISAVLRLFFLFVLRLLNNFLNVVFTTAPDFSFYYCPCFTDKKTKMQ